MITYLLMQERYHTTYNFSENIEKLLHSAIERTIRIEFDKKVE